jgi:TRAP transporter TAXI family solute receptor
MHGRSLSVFGMKRVFFTGLIFLCVLTFFPRTAANAANWPTQLVFGAPSAGTTNYMIAVGIGEVLKKYSPVKNVIVQPLGGPTVWGPMMKKGEVDFAIQSGADTVSLFLGVGGFADLGPIPVRTAIGGHVFPLIFHTTPGKNIKTVADLKGKVVYTSMMGQPMFVQISKSQLASVNLTFDDLKASMVMPSVAQATNDLIEGRVDAFIYPVVPSKVQEINKSKGECVFVDLTEEQVDYVEKNNPGYFRAVIPKGRYANLKEMKWAICFQTCLHVRETMDPAVVYELVKIVLEHHDDWVGTHPQAKQWGLDQKPVTLAAEPYHEGAVKYYKEKGLWTEEVQKHNDELFRKLGKKN